MMETELNGRHAQIVQQLRQNGYTSVYDLAQALNVSEMTVRRDLRTLQQFGLVARHHGGASPSPDPGQPEQPYLVREGTNLEAKRRIGKAALHYVRNGDVIILDAGTTTLELARNLDHQRLTVVSNGLPIIGLLSHSPDINLVATGGTLHWDSQCFVGPIALQALRSINANVAFISTTGLSLQRGLTKRDFNEAEWSRAAIDAAETSILLMDSSKVNNHTLANIGTLELIDVLITDDGLAADDRQAIEARGIKVVLARSDELA